uniref:Uncharacterized protein n=1 Tax=Pseudopediastrum sp. CL0201VA TaxID=2184484 RepID=A0A2U8GJX3_9CHLO|nr:hypothetical protein [Pseudopediastrum sp. CL0201VA]AWI68923.1 hypothetical protein [Pseudopediastrum sp. CL0201VA]
MRKKRVWFFFWNHKMNRQSEIIGNRRLPKEDKRKTHFMIPKRRKDAKKGAFALVGSLLRYGASALQYSIAFTPSAEPKGRSAEAPKLYTEARDDDSKKFLDL